MDRATQTELMERIRDHLASGVDPMAEDVLMHPVHGYVSGEHLEREQQTLFSDYPLVVGYSDQVREPGDFFTDELTGKSLLVVRGDDGVLRGFHNVCGHRGAKVETADRGNQLRFTCPYHAWSYDRNGRLRKIQYDDGFVGVDRDERSLVELPVVERHGLVWAQPGASAGATLDVAGYLGALDEELSSFGMHHYVHERTDVLRQPFNWKLVVDGFLETYHIRFLHRATIGPYINSNFALFDPFGLHARMIGLRASYRQNVIEAAPDAREFLPHIAIIYLIFPNTVLVWQSDHFEVWSVFPDGAAPDRMVARATLLAPSRPQTEAETLHWDKNWKILMKTVLEEDFVIAKTIQHGFESGVRTHAVFGRQEATLQHYHTMLDHEVYGGRASQVTAPRRVAVPA
jgi:phenylpropionate dioxygenase-like ring-hydroxylating dioxygenase large terminal subunit